MPLRKLFGIVTNEIYDVYHLPLIDWLVVNVVHNLWFHSSDDPSKIFILCVSPEGDSGPHIECLAAIATLLSNPETVNKILDSSSAEEIYDIFKG